MAEPESWILRGMAILWLGIGMFCFVFFGQLLQLECSRVQPDRVDCRVQRRWLGLIPMRQPEVLQSLQSARANTTCDDESCTTNVVLRGKWNSVELNDLFFTEDSAEKTVGQLREFLGSAHSELHLTLYDGGMLAFMWPMMTGMFLLPGLWWVWKDGRKIIQELRE
jgi:hypothetical protein